MTKSRSTNLTTTVTLSMSPEYLAAVKANNERLAALPLIAADLKAKYDAAIDRALLDGDSRPLTI